MPGHPTGAAGSLASSQGVLHSSTDGGETKPNGGSGSGEAAVNSDGDVKPSTGATMGGAGSTSGEVKQETAAGGGAAVGTMGAGGHGNQGNQTGQGSNQGSSGSSGSSGRKSTLPVRNVTFACP